MQPYTWASPSARWDYLQNQQQTPNSGHPRPITHTICYSGQGTESVQRSNQQKSLYVSGTYSFSRTNSDNLKSSQSGQLWSNCPQSPVYRSSTSFGATSQNGAAQCQASVQNLRPPTEPSQVNITKQQAYKKKQNIQAASTAPEFCHAFSSGAYTLKDNQIHGSSPYLRHTSNEQHNTMQYLQQLPHQRQDPTLHVQISNKALIPNSNQGHMSRAGASNASAVQYHDASQGSMTQPQPPPCSMGMISVSPSQSQYCNMNQVWNSSVKHVPTNNTVSQSQTKPNLNMGQTLSLPRHSSFVIQSQKKKSIDRSYQSSSECSPQKKPQTFLNARQPSTQALKTSSTIPISGQDRMTIQSFPVHQGNVDSKSQQSISEITLMSALVESILTNKAQISHSGLNNCPTSNARPPPYSGAHNIFTSKAPVPDSGLLKLLLSCPENLSQEKGGQVEKHITSQVQHGLDPASCLNVVTALQKRMPQTQRAVAVIPPISQHVSDPQQNNDVTCVNGDHPIKTGAAWTLATQSENNDAHSKIPDLPMDNSAELEGVNPGNGLTDHVKKSDVLPHRNSPASSIEVPKSKDRTTSQNSNMSPEPTSSADLIAKSPAEQGHDKNIKSSSVNTNTYISKVPVKNITLGNLKDLVKSLEVSAAESEKDTVSDILKCICDLYWDGNGKKMLKALKVARTEGWLKTSLVVSVKDDDDVVFQSLEPSNVKMLAQHFHTLQNEAILSVEKFKSSWQNVGGQPPDIDHVLAEPISDYELTWSKDYSPSWYNSVNHPGDDTEDLSSSIHKDVTETQSDHSNYVPNDIKDFNKAIRKILSEMQLSDKLKNTEKCSEPNQILVKDDVDNYHEDVALVAEPPGLNESNSNTVSKNKDHGSTGEAVCSVLEIMTLKPNQQHLRKDNGQAHGEKCISTSQQNSNECNRQCNAKDSCEMKDASGDANSTNDSTHLEIKLLSTDDIRTIFQGNSKNDFQSESLQFWQDEANTLTTTSLRKSDLVSSKAKTNSLTSHIKFTCPHVTDVVSDCDHFCPKCWDETPLLNIDLDDALLSPQQDGLNIVILHHEADNNQESCSASSGQLPVDKSMCASSEVAQPVKFNKKVDRSVITSFKPDDEIQSRNTASAEPPLLEPSNGGSDIITLPLEDPPVLEPAYLDIISTRHVAEKTEVTSYTSEDFHKALTHSDKDKKRKLIPTSKTLKQNVSSPGPSSCITMTSKMKTMPADNVLSCSNTIKKSISPNGHNDQKHCSNDRKDRHCGKEGKHQLNKTTIQHFTQTKVDNCRADKKLPVYPLFKKSDKGHWKDCNGTTQGEKKVKLALYGSRNNNWNNAAQHLCRDGRHSSSVPDCITISSHADKTYCDQLSAKKKVYKQWSNSFVHPKPHTYPKKRSKLKSFREMITVGGKRKSDAYGTAREVKRLKLV